MKNNIYSLSIFKIALIIILLFGTNNLFAQLTEVAKRFDWPSRIIFIGDELYVADANLNKVSKIDITRPEPVITDIVGIFRPWGLAYRGNDLYIADSQQDIIVKRDLSISTPNTTGVLNIGNGAYLDGLHLVDNMLYVSFYEGNKVVKINIDDPIPVVTDVKTDLRGPAGLTFKDDELYIAEYDAGLIIKNDITNPSADAVTLATGMSSIEDSHFVGN
ncbi:hypothetical protein KDU71_13895 [Carboxylicivirga sediminis]|uniref:Uncharacterized protein n=1 Tax=Carboxylicivirga sediminis TaxID=2006564 RepID=A0A941F671_9BACT|nr:hypothetical protein [Carboxylicivirga sediminis]MBR8536663.1 hypothetical protein [Carboxylicivirga sediminis]